MILKSLTLLNVVCKRTRMLLAVYAVQVEDSLALKRTMQKFICLVLQEGK